MGIVARLIVEGDPERWKKAYERNGPSRKAKEFNTVDVLPSFQGEGPRAHPKNSTQEENSGIGDQRAQGQSPVRNTPSPAKTISAYGGGQQNCRQQGSSRIYENL
jgi:hypothetical protein